MSALNVEAPPERRLPELLNAVQVARLLGVSAATVRRNRMGLRTMLIPGVAGRRYFADDVRRLRDEIISAANEATGRR